MVHDETYSDAQLNNSEELDRAKKYNEELILERETLASQLGETEECVNRLQGIFQFTSRSPNASVFS